MIPIETIREALQIPAQEDDRIRKMRDTVLAQWDRETGLKWGEVTDRVETIRNREDCSKLILLQQALVTSITSVEVRTPPTTTWTSLDSAKYINYDRRALERVDGEYWTPLIRITYSGGYKEVPEVGDPVLMDDIVQALITQIRFMDQRLQTTNIAVKSQNFEGGSGVLLEATFHPLFKEAVSRYKDRT